MRRNTATTLKDRFADARTASSGGEARVMETCDRDRQVSGKIAISREITSTVAMERISCAVFTAGFALATFAAVGALTIAAAPTTATARDKYACMTDDGYGRLRSCSASYKTANPNWRGGDSCYTDDGYGRYRTCSASYKAKHAK
jgi:hypothetical protein